MLSALRLRVVRGLERGNGGTLVGAALSRLWNRAAGPRICRPLVLAPGVRIVGVGGATLGGSGKTPFAIALARSLAGAGARAALVGHAHRASPDRPRVVSPDDDVREVGDDALVAARSLAHCGVDVVVGPTRQAAVDFAAHRADILVVDGLLQARPDRLFRSLLVVDGDQPWGAGVTPPLGDLEASRDLLMEATDSLIVFSETLTPSGLSEFSRPSRIARSTLLGAIAPNGAPVAFSELGREAFGLLLGIARPERVSRALAKRGLFPRATVRFADHLLPTPRELQMAEKAARTERLRAWLCTAKCRTRLPPAVSGVPVLVLDHQVEVPAAELDVFAT